MFLQKILQKRLNALNEEEERYLNASGAGMLKGQKSQLLAGTGADIIGGGFGQGGLSGTAKTIGSIKNGQINYSMEHTFFNTQTHMKPSVQRVRSIVKEEIDRDLLGTKPHKWNPSVSLPQKEIGEDLQNLQLRHQRFLISKGFADEKITRPKPQITYGGCDTREVYYHGWDVSIEKTPPRDKERQYQIERAFLLDKTTRAANKIIQHTQGQTKTSYGIESQSYLRPQMISQKFNEKLRVEKESEVELWKKLLEEARFEMPGATQEKLNAFVYKKIQNIKHGKKEEIDPELTFYPNCSLSQASKAPLPQKKKRRGQLQVKSSSKTENKSQNDDKESSDSK